MRAATGLLLATTVLAAVWAAGCARPAADHPAPPSIVLVVWDTVAARHVGCLDPDGGPTPHLDRLAADGVLFRRAHTTAPWTQPAVATILTGRWPSRHGVLRLFDVLGEEQHSLAEQLAAAGWATAGVVSHELLEARFGVAQGFGSWNAEPVSGHEGITSERVTDLAIDWLRDRPDGPFFLLVHYFDPHMLYHDHAGFGLTEGYDGPMEPAMGVWAMRDARDRMSGDDVAFLRALHREEVAFTDLHTGRLLAALDELADDDPPIVVVTADHGEEIMEHGWIGHTRTLYDELVHVPLVVRIPGGPRGRVVDRPVSLVDLAPTLADLAGAPFEPSSVDGRSLAPLLAEPPGPVADLPLFAEVSFTVGPGDDARHLEKVAFLTAIMDGPHKLVHDLMAGDWRLYDRAADPAELRDVLDTDPRAAALRRRLEAWQADRAGHAPAAPRLLPGADELDRLRALGYVR